MNIADDERKAIEDLLPWRAAGTLSRGETQRVDAALAADPELARRYALVREEVTQTIQLNEALGAPSPRALDVLFAKIDAEPGRKPAAAPANILDRVVEFFASLSPRTLAFGAAAAALVLTLQAGVIGSYVLKDKASGDYETASEAKQAARRGVLCLDPLRAADQCRCDHPIPPIQQIDDCQWSFCRRSLPRPRDAYENIAGRSPKSCGQIAARQSRRLYRAVGVTSPCTGT